MKYRDDLTLPEALLWQRLRRRPLGLVFRKQHPIGRLKLDFYCAERALAVEVDGQVHDGAEAADHDARRDAWLAGQGIDTLRVPATEVLRDIEAAADGIVRYAAARVPVFVAAARRRRGPSDPLRGPPPHQDGEDLVVTPALFQNPPHLDGEVAARSAVGGARAPTNEPTEDPA